MFARFAASHSNMAYSEELVTYTNIRLCGHMGAVTEWKIPWLSNGRAAEALAHIRFDMSYFGQ
jgi:hypothetical protein